MCVRNNPYVGNVTHLSKYRVLCTLPFSVSRYYDSVLCTVVVLCNVVRCTLHCTGAKVGEWKSD